MQVRISEAIPMLEQYLLAKLVPMIWGSPGIGKSDIVKAIAQKYRLKLIDLRLAQCDPTDLCGFPSVQGNRAGYVPMETFPIDGDAIPAGYNGWLLFLDELTSAPPAIQAASYKLILDRMVGNHPLHEKIAIVAAGNKETDGAIVEPMSTALQSRLAHMELVVDHAEWIDWATGAGIDHHITDYIRFKPGALYTFDPQHTDHTYAAPRTWEFANRVIQTAGLAHPQIRALLSGVLSEGVAREFVGFTEIYTRLPKMSSIEAAPEVVDVPDEPSILFALTGSISNHATTDNMGQYIKFIKRLPAEFQAICLKETVRRNKAMLAHPAVQSWTAKEGAALF